jgi:hypothetical protein
MTKLARWQGPARGCQVVTPALFPSRMKLDLAQGGTRR